MASDLVQYVTDQNFKTEVLQAKATVLVDFTATWCGPCKALSPIIDTLASEYPGALKVVKLDIDSSPETPSHYRVRGVPTVMLFKNGEEVARKVGLTSKVALVGIIEPLLVAS